MTGTLLRDSKEETAYLEVSDTEIELWDSAADGALLGTAKYPQALPARRLRCRAATGRIWTRTETAS